MILELEKLATNRDLAGTLSHSVETLELDALRQHGLLPDDRRWMPCWAQRWMMAALQRENSEKLCTEERRIYFNFIVCDMTGLTPLDARNTY